MESKRINTKPLEGARLSFFKRHGEVIKRDIFVGFWVGIILALFAFLLTAGFQSHHFKHQEVLENTRFARQLSLTDGRKPLSGLNLREAELSSLNLRGVNLARANLTGVDLRWAVLNGRAYLAMADLTDADLTGANLTEAILVKADLTGANLTNAYLNDANLAGADITGADLTNADLSGVLFERHNDEETISGICYDSSTVWPDGHEVGQEPECE